MMTTLTVALVAGALVAPVLLTLLATSNGRVLLLVEYIAAALSAWPVAGLARGFGLTWPPVLLYVLAFAVLMGIYVVSHRWTIHGHWRDWLRRRPRWPRRRKAKASQFDIDVDSLLEQFRQEGKI